MDELLRRRQMMSGGTFPPPNQIWYTTTDEQIITPSGFTILSNTYKGGIGKIVTNSRLSEVPARSFRNITTLDTVWLPETVTQINSGAFANSSISKITGYGVSVIKGYKDLQNLGAFANTTSLLSAEFPNVVAIESQAFSHCDNLQDFIFDNVESIGNQAFRYCAGLTDVYLPKLVTLSTSAFADSGLVTFTAPILTSLPEHQDLARHSAFNNCSNLEEVTLGEIDIIPTQCFNNSSKLHTLNINFSKLREIKDRAFEGCSSLRISINAPILTTMGYNSFKNSGIENITIPRVLILQAFGGTIYSDSPLAYAKSLQSVTLEDIQEIGYRAFTDCSSLESLIIDNTTPPTIGNDVFRNIRNMPNIYVPDSAVDTYKSASGWSSYANRIKPISELPLLNQ